MWVQILYLILKSLSVQLLLLVVIINIRRRFLEYLQLDGTKFAASAGAEISI